MPARRIEVQHELGEYRKVISLVVSYAQHQPDRKFIDIRLIVNTEYSLPYRDRKVSVGKIVGSLQKPLQQYSKGCFSGIVFADKKCCFFPHVEAAVLQKPEVLNFNLFNMHFKNTPDFAVSCAAPFWNSLPFFVKLSCRMPASKK